jgi:demethylmenaquinone methyltransferase/2-methoxy-6-polyprenyl-1,4-benzoquinol methylase
MNDGAKGAALPPHPALQGYYERVEEKQAFVRELFDESAGVYDQIEGMMAFGTGRWYRRQALERAGLKAGLRALDVAVGTGLVAREAITLTGDRRLVLGVDPSAGMLHQARRLLGLPAVQGLGERLPCRDGSFDFVSMGYALRHLADLAVTFKEFRRVLRPGGVICVLELTRPAGRIGHALLKTYLQRVIPLVTRLTTRNRQAERLMRYFWDTIAACVPPEEILAALSCAGFGDVRRTVVLGIFSEYVGSVPEPGKTHGLACKATD